MDYDPLVDPNLFAREKPFVDPNPFAREKPFVDLNPFAWEKRFVDPNLFAREKPFVDPNLFTADKVGSTSFAGTQWDPGARAWRAGPVGGAQRSRTRRYTSDRVGGCSKRAGEYCSEHGAWHM